MKAKLFIASLLVMAGLLTFAQNQESNNTGSSIEKRKEQREGNKAKRHERMLETLDLSAEQKTKVEQLKLEHQKRMLGIENQLREKEARLKTLNTTDPINKGDIDKTIDEIGALKTKMMKEKNGFHQSVRALLNDEQKIKFDTRPMGQNRGEGRKHNNSGERHQRERCINN